MGFNKHLRLFLNFKTLAFLIQFPLSSLKRPLLTFSCMLIRITKKPDVADKLKNLAFKKSKNSTSSSLRSSKFIYKVFVLLVGL